MTNDVTYSSTIENWIISNLDGWRIQTTTEEPETTTEINPYMTTAEANEKANKVITSNECQLFYEETLDMAYMHTNRLNIDDLTEVESRVFLRAVCKWTASNLWNKYNIRVNNEDLEDTYIQSYGGLLYKSAIKTLSQFINQRVKSMTNLTGDTEDNNDLWIV